MQKDESELEINLNSKDSSFKESFNTEPYRKKLYFIAARLKANLETVEERLLGKVTITPAIAFHHVNEFLQDLYLIRNSLISHNDIDIAKHDLRDLIRLVETCGFSLYELEVRQESTIHTRTTIEILKQFDPENAYDTLFRRTNVYSC